MKKTFIFSIFIFLLVFIVGLYANPLSFSSDIRSEIIQYEWAYGYFLRDSYEKTCDHIFWLLPVRLQDGDYSNSLYSGKEWDLLRMDDCFFPNYGGIYQNGIPMKNRSYEECYAKTLEVLKTLHKEYIKMGIIKKKT
jgi:hypothetical protein